MKIVPKIDILQLARHVVAHDVIVSGKHDTDSIRIQVRDFLLKLLTMQIPQGASIAEDCKLLDRLCRRIEKDIQETLNQRGASGLHPPKATIIVQN